MGAKLSLKGNQWMFPLPFNSQKLFKISLIFLIGSFFVLLSLQVSVLMVSSSPSIVAPPKEDSSLVNSNFKPSAASMTNANSLSNKKPNSLEMVGDETFHTLVPLQTLRGLYMDPFRQLKNSSASNPTPKTYPPVQLLSNREQLRILVTGGAGFVGSHLVDRLMLMGHQVICLDNLFTGSKRNIEHWMGHPNFEFVRHDVTDPYTAEVDQIYHLACPASPPHYQYNPTKTIKTSVLGTLNMLGLAKRVKAKFLFTSTSEVYGDPEVHPQSEEYWGHVNPIGPRACYDEGKRVAETLTYSYAKQDEVDVRVARIFNTFGPRMNEEDGRVVSNFIIQSLKGQNLTVYGNGSQTRSFQYVHDLVDGLLQLMASNYTLPVNLGNPQEYTIKDFAQVIRDKINPNCKIVYSDALVDDPQKRRPDISRAEKFILWKPKFTMEQGIEETIEYFKNVQGVQGN